MKMKSNLQVKLAIASFIVAVAFSVAGFIIPPTGDLTDANLYLVAQFLLVTTSILGVSAVVSGRPPTNSPEGEGSRYQGVEPYKNKDQ